MYLVIEGEKDLKKHSSLKKSLVAKHNFGMIVDYPESKFYKTFLMFF